MSVLTVRPIGDLFTSFADASPFGLKPPVEAYLAGLHRWYRPEWSWVALRNGAVVAPAHGGHGYADEIDAMTDVGNAPMAAAFERCGYTVVDRMLVHV